MLQLQAVQAGQGAQFAPDNIPLQFLSPQAEYAHAAQHAILLDRSHEGRLQLQGKDRLEFMHRISTNDLLSMPPNTLCGTVFTQANARLIDRVTVLNHPEYALLLTEPGRGAAMRNFLQSKIFFNDDAQLADIGAHSAHFLLVGEQAPAIVARWGVTLGEQPLQMSATQIEGQAVIIARLKPLVYPTYAVIVLTQDAAGAVWQALTSQEGVMPAGSLAYNMLRIEAGKPAFSRELSNEHLPLEIGLWDEVSFSKGCYTGQEIIARMESRNQLARVLVHVVLSAPLVAPVPLLVDGKEVGTLTSAVTLPSGANIGLAVVKVSYAQAQTTLLAQTDVTVTVGALAGSPPPERMLSRGE